jgi:hypothetical protein
MRARQLILRFAFLALLGLSAVSARSQTVITFDDLSETATGSFIANGYQGLSWSNMWCINAALNPTIYPFHTNGFYYGMVSASNVAGTIGQVEMDSPGTNFNFLSVYLTGAWNSNLNIEVQGFRGTALLYDQTVMASATNATLFAFYYSDIDRLTFNSFGGQPAFSGSSGEHFAIDNLTFEFVPEPSSLLLTTAGVLTLCAFLKRKRA